MGRALTSCRSRCRAPSSRCPRHRTRNEPARGDRGGRRKHAAVRSPPGAFVGWPTPSWPARSRGTPGTVQLVNAGQRSTNGQVSVLPPSGLNAHTRSLGRMSAVRIRPRPPVSGHEQRPRSAGGYPEIWALGSSRRLLGAVPAGTSARRGTAARVSTGLHPVRRKTRRPVAVCRVVFYLALLRWSYSASVTGGPPKGYGETPCLCQAYGRW